uniref:hypothetical protein n=1 Tax=Sargassum polycystum TaxID=127578 RepID=UPI0020C84468|nr:hypothetical protein NNX83_pgp096 [Sargassum polycystum]YP_010418292.1 hypothetical protein Ycf34 [Sargassum plagiophyllum]USF18276.1 hypothetical protein [Sargassum polycystum]USF18510.1 hypothetical protein Ycf34 [Sargassum plagiophyllum]
MCICLNCERIDNCNIFISVEKKHKENSKRIIKTYFFPQSTILLCINFFSKKNLYTFEWDVNECLSYQEKPGTWLDFSSKPLESSTYLLFDFLFY